MQRTFFVVDGEHHSDFVCAGCLAKSVFALTRRSAGDAPTVSVWQADPMYFDDADKCHCCGISVDAPMGVPRG